VDLGEIDAQDAADRTPRRLAAKTHFDISLAPLAEDLLQQVARSSGAGRHGDLDAAVGSDLISSWALRRAYQLTLRRPLGTGFAARLGTGFAARLGAGFAARSFSIPIALRTILATNSFMVVASCS
jgi:hypothetical protein